MKEAFLNALPGRHWTDFPFVLFLIAGSLVSIFALVGLDFSYFPGEHGDTRFNMYILEHGFRFITGQIESFWDASFFYPAQHVIAYSDNLIGNLPLYVPLRLLGLSMERSFQLWFVICMTLNYVSAYWVLRKFGLISYSAAIGAFIFAFSLALGFQLHHSQLLPRYFVPLLFYYLWHYSNTFSKKFFFMALAWWTIGLYSSPYLAFLSIVPAAVFFLTALFSLRHQHLLLASLRRHRLYYLSVIALVVFLALVLLIPYVRFGLHGGWTYDGIADSIPHVTSYLVSVPNSFYGILTQPIRDSFPNWQLHVLFMGLVTSSLLMIGIAYFAYRKIKKIRNPNYILFNCVVFSQLITFLFFTRFGDFSMYRILHLLPGFSSIRDVARIINIELFTIGFIVASVVQFLIHTPTASQISKRSYSTIGLVIASIAGLVLVVEHYIPYQYSIRLPMTECRQRIETLQAKVKPQIVKGKANVMAFLPENPSDAGYALQIDAMLVAQRLNIKTVNGYSAYPPLEYGAFWDKLTEENFKLWQEKYPAYFKDVNLIIVR